MANFTISPSNGTGNGTITVTASYANTNTTTNKTGTVTVSASGMSKTVAVRQMYRPQLYFTTSFATTTEIDAPVISSSGGYVYMRVQSPYPFWFKAGAGVFTSDNDIVDEDGNTYGLRDSLSPIPATKKVFKIRIPANTSTNDTQIDINIVFTRKDGRLSTSTTDATTYFRKYVTVRGRTLLRSLEIDPLSYVFPSSGETKRFAITFQGRLSDEQLVVTSSVPNNWTVSSIVWGSSTSTTGYIEVTAGMGTNVEQSGNIVIKTLDNSLSRTISLTQSAVQTYEFRITGLRDTDGNTYDINNPVILSEGKTYILEIYNDDAIMNVTCDATYVTIDSVSWDADEITFHVEKNTGIERQFTIGIEGNMASPLSITITQPRSSYISIEGIQDEDGSVFSVYPANEKTYYLYYTSTDMPVIATASASWIRMRGNDNNGIVTFILSENTGDARSASITIVSAKGMTDTANIEQASGSVQYIDLVSLLDEDGNDIGTNNPVLPYYGGVFVLNYDTNDPPIVVTKSDVDWFDVTPYPSLSEVDIEVTRVMSSVERHGWVKITTAHNREAILYFTQSGNTTYISLDSYEITATNYTGDNYTVNVSANTPWTCSTDASWVVLDSPLNSGGKIGSDGDATLRFHTTDNNTGAIRNTTIVFKDSTNTIADVIFNISQNYNHTTETYTYSVFDFDSGDMVNEIPSTGGEYRIEIYDGNDNIINYTPTILSTENIETIDTNTAEIYFTVSEASDDRLLHIEYQLPNGWRETIEIPQSGTIIEPIDAVLGLRFNQSSSRLEVFVPDGYDITDNIEITMNLKDMGTWSSSLNYSATLTPTKTTAYVGYLTEATFNGWGINAVETVPSNIAFSRLASEGFIQVLDMKMNTTYDNIRWVYDDEEM